MASSQVKILLWKNALLWRRGWLGSACEVLIVVAFAGLMLFVDSLVKVVSKPDTSYLRQGDTYPLSPPGPLAVLPYPSDYVAFNQIFMDKAKRSIMKDCVSPDETNGFRGGSVALIPPGNQINAQLESLFTGMGLKVRYFNSFKELNTEVVQPWYPRTQESQICFGVSFESFDLSKSQFTYNMIYNLTGSFEYQRDLADTKKPENFIFLYQKENTELFLKYLYNGAAILQHIIDTLLIRAAKADQSIVINAQMVKAPVSAYSQSNLYQITSGSISIYIIFPIVLIYLRFVYFLLFEKEHRIAQNLRNMGMRIWTYYTSWILMYTGVLTFISLVWTGMVGFTFFRHSNKFLVFLLFFLTGFFLLSLGFCLSALFTRAKPGVLACLVMFFILYAGNIGIQAIAEPTESQLSAFSISPFAGLEKASSLVVLLEASGFGFGFVNFFEKINNYRFSTFVFITLGESIFFFLLGAYLDQVFPTETGVKKHPLFFLGYSRSPKSKSNKVVPLPSAQGSDSVIEPVDPGLAVQVEEGRTVSVRNLEKTYSNGKHAVRGLSVDMYPDQIFALLGHNGAGKTTTISMLSGLVDKSAGNISVLGLDSQRDADAIRHVMGVCPQTNPLYADLTVAEHLALYSAVKGGGHPGEIEKLLADLDLLDKKNYPAGKLSGGQKRKLCVALAFVGGSRVVILDEPTSGMDTYARRHLWEMLKGHKKGKILLLTTHYMDEADYLGDRIAIMGEGKLLTCGSGLFLKARFGGGYDLTIVKTAPEIPSQPLLDHIHWFVPEAKVAGDVSMELKVQLPVAAAPQFEALFHSLAEHSQQLGLQTFGVSMTTLEEVFLKVALSAAEQEGLTPLPPPTETPLELDEIRIKDHTQLFRMHFNALCKKRFLYFRRDYKGLLCEIVLPILVIICGLLVTLVNFFHEFPQMTLHPAAIPRPQTCVYNSPTADFFASRSAEKNLNLVSKNFGSIYEMDDWLMRHSDDNRFYSYYVDNFNPSTRNYNYSIFLNTTNPYGLNVAVNIMNQEILRSLTGKKDASISAGIQPMANTLFWLSFENAFQGLTAVFLISLAYSFIPSGIITFIVYERENNVKHQQNVSGVSLLAYWTSNYAIDYIKYLICGIFTCVAIKIFGIKAFTGEQTYAVVWLLMLLNGPALILYTYCMAFFFKSPSSAQVFTFVFNYLTGFVLMMVAYILRLVDSTRPAMTNGVEYVFRLLPAFDFSFGLFSLPNDTVWLALYSLSSVPDPWGWYGARKELIAQAVLIVISILVIYFFEHSKGSVDKKKPVKVAQPVVMASAPKSSQNNILQSEGDGLVSKANIKEGADPVSPAPSAKINQDNEVLAEEQKVALSEDFAVKVFGMSKIFTIVKGSLCSRKKLVSRKVAVNGISFGVKKGECFGLLGTNGAGKTTTFKILTGELHQSAGVARVNGKDLETHMHQISHQIGYCPQFDALLANLTAREHLELYAAIKGIPEHLRPAMIRDLLLRLGLSKFEHVQAGTYSGGNKRKLSVAIALLGNPPVVFLDEPSSGMDPEARRFMWSVVAGITAGKSNTSVVLTTHSMDEAEALSNKLAIMVEGQIKCIGSVQQLKHKYGHGYEIETKIRQAEPTEVDTILQLTELSPNLEEEIDKQTVIQAFQKAGTKSLLESLESGTGDCSLIATQLRNKKNVKKLHVVDLIYLERRANKISETLSQKFGKVSLIENFQSFYRFKVEEDVPLASIFGCLEKQRTQIGLLQYSVKQTSIEQIFIGFANQRAVEDD